MLYLDFIKILDENLDSEMANAIQNWFLVCKTDNATMQERFCGRGLMRGVDGKELAGNMCHLHLSDGEVLYMDYSCRSIFIFLCILYIFCSYGLKPYTVWQRFGLGESDRPTDIDRQRTETDVDRHIDGLEQSARHWDTDRCEQTGGQWHTGRLMQKDPDKPVGVDRQIDRRKQR